MSKLQTILDLQKQRDEFERNLRETAKTGLSDIFKEVFNKHQGLKAIVFQGYTPSFNDGEPCEHSSYVSVGQAHYQNSWRNDGTFWLSSNDDIDGYECYEDFFEVEYDKEARTFSSINSSCQTLKQAYEELSSLTEIVDMVYDTNFEVYIKLEDDGSVSITDNYYDCGY